MIYLILCTLFGAIQRRWFGGAGSSLFQKLTFNLLGSGKTISRFAILLLSIPMFMFQGWEYGIPLAGLLVLLISIGVDFNRPWLIAAGYSLPLILISFYFGFYIGILVALFPTISSVFLRTKTIYLNSYIDGWEAVWELILGASFGFVSAGSAVYGAPVINFLN